jgi:hypothetical protein
MSLMRIRAAGESDLAVMQDIERAAGGWFREVGMPEIAEDEPFSVEELAWYRKDGHAWVAVDAGDVPVAYLIADLVDDSYLRQDVANYDNSPHMRAFKAPM